VVSSEDEEEENTTTTPPGSPVHSIDADADNVVQAGQACIERRAVQAEKDERSRAKTRESRDARKRGREDEKRKRSARF